MGCKDRGQEALDLLLADPVERGVRGQGLQTAAQDGDTARGSVAIRSHETVVVS